MSSISKENNLCIDIEVDSWNYKFIKETALLPEHVKKKSVDGFIDERIYLQGKSASPYHCLPEEYLETIGYQDFDSKERVGIDRRLNYPNFVNAKNLNSSLDYLNIYPSELKILNFERIFLSRRPPFSGQSKSKPFEYESGLSLTASLSNSLKKFDKRFEMAFSIDKRNRILWQEISDATRKKIIQTVKVGCKNTLL